MRSQPPSESDGEEAKKKAEEEAKEAIDRLVAEMREADVDAAITSRCCAALAKVFSSTKHIITTYSSTSGFRPLECTIHLHRPCESSHERGHKTTQGHAARCSSWSRHRESSVRSCVC